MKQPEARFKSKMVEMFEELFPLGWCSYIQAPKYGVPDLVFKIPGHPECWVEGKANGGVLSSYQEAMHAKMTRAGQQLRVIDASGITPGSKWKDWILLVERPGGKRSAMSALWLGRTSFWEDLCT